MLLVRVQKFCAPEFLITEKMVLWCATACEREPLHVVSRPDVVVGGIIEPRMRGGRWNDRRQMWRKFFRRGPLIKSRVRAAPHGDLAIAKRLLRQPLDNIMPVTWLVCERLEFAAGISASAHIHKCERVAMRREIRGAGVIGIC